ncbi:MAG: DUF1877 family protein [Leptolyngbyaceae cyanobacterium bins.302]|nr:DUF1877 family protein [Leptolyngbyaceae cyanobacterium bins.302]
MSSEVFLQQLSPEILKKIEQGEVFFNLFWGAKDIENPENWEEEIEEQFVLSDNDRLRISRESSADIASILAERKKYESPDLGVDWNTIHDFLTGEEGSFDVPYLISEMEIDGSNVVLVNAFFGANKMRYDSTVNYLTSEQVRQVADVLTKILSNFEERLSLLGLDWYLEDLTDDDGTCWFGDYFQNFVNYYNDAAANNNAMLMVGSF